MISPARTDFQDDNCILEPVEDFNVFDGFCCGDDDLDDFIVNDALPHKEKLLAVTYAFHLKRDGEISVPVAYVSLLNDSIRHLTTSRKKKKFPQAKRYNEFPAVKIGRLAVMEGLAKTGIGTNLVTVLKHIFTTANRTGCRFMTVDAYRNAIEFYEKNDFNFVQPKDKDGDSETVSMFFDLMRFAEAMKEE
ncbi:MAG: GNAT family N-acetyltransferase [Pseudodesulfovibrio sp.]|nr:GNAT family N-acetyltransferase [Pseudodesulfovibrio sp.]